MNPETELLDTRSPEHAADLAKWMAFLTGDLHPAFWPASMPGRYTMATDEVALGDVKEAGLGLLRGKLAQLERQLGCSDWTVGGKRALVDAYATPMLNRAEAMLPRGLPKHPGLAAHRRRMQTDPAVCRAVADEGVAVNEEEQRHEHA